MTDNAARFSPSRRDRAIQRVRRASWVVGAATAGLAAALSAVAANAFKGHPHGTPAASPHRSAKKARRHVRRVAVPGPQHVPAIAASTDGLTPPSSAPAPAPSTQPPPSAPASPAPAPAPAPAPQTSGGS